MKIIVVGCGRVGVELATRLDKKGHQVSVIDISKASSHELPLDFGGQFIEGEAMHQDILLRAGIENADGVAVVTSNDSVNAVVGHIARQVYDIPIVAVRNFDSRWRPLHETFGHQMVSSSSWGAQRIEELLYHVEGHTLFSVGNGEVELYEFTVEDNWEGRTIQELLGENKQCLLAAVTRAGEGVLPKPEMVLQTGDLLLVSATLEGSMALRARLAAGPAA